MIWERGRVTMRARQNVKAAFLMLTLGLLSACDWMVASESERSQPRSDAEVDFAKAVLNELQQQSFDQDREYCGFIGLDEEGEFIATDPIRGEKDGCQPEEPDADIDILASYHTHAAFSEGFDSERPSTDDLEADIEEGIDGYVATPGGRLWLNDAAVQQTRMLCGSFCLIHDSRYEPFEDLPLRSIYSLDQLRERDLLVE